MNANTAKVAVTTIVFVVDTVGVVAETVERTGFVCRDEAVRQSARAVAVDARRVAGACADLTRSCSGLASEAAASWRRYPGRSPRRGFGCGCAGAPA